MSSVGGVDGVSRVQPVSGKEMAGCALVAAACFGLAWRYQVKYRLATLAASLLPAVALATALLSRGGSEPPETTEVEKARLYIRAIGWHAALPSKEGMAALPGGLFYELRQSEEVAKFVAALDGEAAANYMFANCGGSDQMDALFEQFGSAAPGTWAERWVWYRTKECGSSFADVADVASELPRALQVAVYSALAEQAEGGDELDVSLQQLSDYDAFELFARFKDERILQGRESLPVSLLCGHRGAEVWRAVSTWSGLDRAISKLKDHEAISLYIHLNDSCFFDLIFDRPVAQSRSESILGCLPYLSDQARWERSIYNGDRLATALASYDRCSAALQSAIRSILDHNLSEGSPHAPPDGPQRCVVDLVKNAPDQCTLGKEPISIPLLYTLSAPLLREVEEKRLGLPEQEEAHLALFLKTGALADEANAQLLLEGNMRWGVPRLSYACAAALLSKQPERLLEVVESAFEWKDGRGEIMRFFVDNIDYAKGLDGYGQWIEQHRKSVIAGYLSI